jgi:hypothetical protein
MRLATIFSIGVIAVSTAALAQVGQGPVEQKLGNDMATANALPPANEAEPAPANTMDSPTGNVAESAPPAGEPDRATSAPPK